MLALPLLALWTAALVAAREKNETPGFWMLPVMALWALRRASSGVSVLTGVAKGADASASGVEVAAPSASLTLALKSWNSLNWSR